MDIDDAPVTITGKLASDAAYAVSEHHSGRADISQVNQLNAMFFADVQKGSHTKN